METHENSGVPNPPMYYDWPDGVLDSQEDGVWYAVVNTVAGHYASDHRLSYLRYAQELLEDIDEAVFSFLDLLKRGNITPQKEQAIMQAESNWKAYCITLVKWIDDTFSTDDLPLWDKHVKERIMFYEQPYSSIPIDNNS